jgi:hypothetical protein
MPTPECLVDAVRAVDGVANVAYAADEISTSWLFPRLRTDTSHLITYVYAGIGNQLRLYESADGSVKLSHGYGPSQETVDTLYPVWLEVETSLQERCGISGLGPEVTEICLGVRCPQEWKPGEAVYEYLDAIAAGGYAETLRLIHPDGLENAKRAILSALAEPDPRAPLSLWGMPPLELDIPVLRAPASELAAIDAAELVRRVIEQQPVQNRFINGHVIGASTLEDSFAFWLVAQSVDANGAHVRDELLLIEVKAQADEWMVANIGTISSLVHDETTNTERENEEAAAMAERLRKLLRTPPSSTEP